MSEQSPINMSPEELGKEVNKIVKPMLEKEKTKDKEFHPSKKYKMYDSVLSINKQTLDSGSITFRSSQKQEVKDMNHKSIHSRYNLSHDIKPTMPSSQEYKNPTQGMYHKPYEN